MKKTILLMVSQSILKNSTIGIMRNFFKNKILFVFFVNIIVLNSGYHQIFATEADYFEQLVTIQFSQKDLGTVLEKLSEMSGIKIIYDEQLSKKVVSGMYDEVPLRIVIHRLLKGTNNSLTLDEKEKTLLIKGFGQTKYIATNVGSGTFGLLETDLVDVELNKLHAKQLKEFELEQTNKDTFLEEFGMTLGELETMHEEQTTLFVEEQNDSNNTLPEFGLTSSEYKSIVKEQLSVYSDELVNGTSKLSEFGMTYSEYKEAVERQIADFNRYGGEFLPEFGMTSKALQSQYSKQMQIFKDSVILSR